MNLKELEALIHMEDPPTMGEKRRVFSSTQLTMLQRCGMQYFYRYVEGIKMAPTVALLRGSAVHTGVAVNLRQKIKSGVELPVDDVKDAARDAVDAAFMGEIALTEEERSRGMSLIKGDTKDMAIGLAALHTLKVSPTFQPVAVEKQITLRTDPAIFPMDLTGIIDVEDDAAAVRDTKTSSKAPNEDAAETSEQLTMYALLYQAEKGRLPSEVVLDTLVRTKGGKETPYLNKSARTEADLHRLTLRLGKAAEAIEKEVFIPTNPESWWCSANWCGYYNICAFGKSRR
jgi:Uncharacterized protein conserved in archaea